MITYAISLRVLSSVGESKFESFGQVVLSIRFNVSMVV
jgi:hypothetical protein